jgi:hypothetical protein
LIEEDKTGDDRADAGSTEGGSGIGDVEAAGETTAAATGMAERGAAIGDTTGDTITEPVGADTMVKVADGPDSKVKTTSVSQKR